MRIARSAPRAGSPIISAADSSKRKKKDPKASRADGSEEKDPSWERQRSPPPLDRLINDTCTAEVAFLPESDTTTPSGGGARVGSPAARNCETECSGQIVTVEDDFATVDRALKAALGGGVLAGTTKKEDVGKGKVDKDSIGKDAGAIKRTESYLTV